MQQLGLLQCEISRVYGMLHQAARVTPVHVLKDQSREEGAGGDWDVEQRNSASREYGPSRPGGRNEGFPASSVFDATLPPKSGAGEGNGDEFNSPRGGENRGRQTNERGDKSTDKARLRSPRGDVLAWMGGVVLGQKSKTNTNSQ